MYSVEFKNNKIILIDQRKIPQRLEKVIFKSPREVANAIKKMVVRGAPAIGIAACYALAISKNWNRDVKLLKNSRPTAVDLFNAIEYMLEESRIQDPIKKAKIWHKGILDKTRKISKFGASLIKNNSKVLLHCNTGPLSTAAFGTALGAVIEAKRQGKDFEIFVGETRPRFQGAITSWELAREKIKHKVITDSSAGFLMKKKMIDLVFVGADRIVRNGDVANKIGTYSLGVLAKENKIPFVVLAPISSFDFSLKSGDLIKIEEREEKEVLEILKKRIYGKKSKALNLAFDVTPSKYVTKYITEYGIHKRVKEISKYA